MKSWIILLCLSSGWMQVDAAAAAAAAAAVAAVTPTPPSAPVTPTVDENAQLLGWLMKYGYLPPSDSSTPPQLRAWTAVTGAVRAMQRFAGLRDTGVVDEETLALMKTPRCSLPDQDEASGVPQDPRGGGRLRRRRNISTWTRRNINWRLHSYPSSPSLSRETIRSLVFYALRVWSEPTPLDFHEVGGPDSADLLVDFLHGYHGDGYPFDGAGGSVGHAFFPSDVARAGGVHLDAEEEWAFRRPAAEGTDLFTVLVHEFGHALGLSHSSSRHSVMRPYYQGPAGDPLHYRLGPHDLEHITQLYGKREDVQGSAASADTQLEHGAAQHPLIYGSGIDRCNTSFDAVARIRGETFFFKGQTMWRVSVAGLVSAGGSSVRRLWKSLPPDLPALTAVLERASDHAIVFISGSQFWLFRDLTLQEGSPQPLSSLGTRRSSVGGAGNVARTEAAAAAERWGLVWEPQEGATWGNLGDYAAGEGAPENPWTRILREGVSGITIDSNGSVCLFRGDSYWRFTSPGSAPEAGYPRSTAADWLDCPDTPSPPPGPDRRAPLAPPPAGRQEVRERAGGRRIETGDGADVGSSVWTHCSCHSGAAREGSEPAFAPALLLLTWMCSSV